MKKLTSRILTFGFLVGMTTLAYGVASIYKASAATMPIVTSIAPTTGPLAGGTAVTITGSGFTSSTAVEFGTSTAESFAVASDTAIIATSSAGTGMVDVTIVNASGTSATSSADRFTYATGAPYTITVTQGSNGTITPGTQTADLASGTNEPFAIIPAVGYQVSNILVDGTSVGSSTLYSFINIMANHTITATFSAVPTGAGPAAVNLLSTANFVILSEAGITEAGASVITGNIGSSPITAAAMNNVFCSEMKGGTIYGVNAAYTGSGATTCFAGNPGVPAVTPPIANKTLVDNAVGDLTTAYNAAAGMTNPTSTELGAGNISGLTIAPGLYKWTTNVAINSDVYLNGGPNDIWVFQVAGNLNVASAGSVVAGTHVVLEGGARAKNIFWQVGGSTGATLGTYSTFNGTILSATQVILQTGAVLNGRALAETQVTLDSNVVTIPALTASLSTSTTSTSTIATTTVTGITLNEASNTLTVGGTDQLVPTITPASSTNVGVAWSSGNASVATVDASGLVTAVNAGSATITVTASDTTNGVFTATDLITVNAAASGSSVSVASGGGGGGGGGYYYIPVVSSTTVTSTTIPSLPNTGLASGVAGTSGALNTVQGQLLALLVEQLQILLKQAQAQGITLSADAAAYLNVNVTPSLLSAITQNLTIGSSGADVTALQTFLIAQAKGSAASALDTVGVTGRFGSLTQAALAEYQSAEGITPAQGYFGSRTRTFLQAAGF